MKSWRVVAGGAAFVVSLAVAAVAFAANNLTQIGVALHSDGTNNLSQIGIALHDGYTYQGLGGIQTVIGDGSVRLISVGGGTQETFCFHGANTVGTIQDGSSNTIFLGGNVGLSVVPTVLGGAGSTARSVLDGTSNTILLGETPTCVGGVTGIGETPGDPTNEEPGIHVGSGGSFDLCLSSARVVTIADGSSNTITFEEDRNAVCFNNIVPPNDINVVAATAPEPGSLVLLTAALLGLMALGRCMHARSRTR